jgi:ribosome-binding protein aMBF1 (putative translation factor)
VKVEGRFSTRLLVESGWKLSKGKENRLEAKLSHDYQDRTSKRRETDGVSQPQRTGIAVSIVDLIEQSRLAVDELIDVAGRATIEAVLELRTSPRQISKRRIVLTETSPSRYDNPS